MLYLSGDISQAAHVKALVTEGKQRFGNLNGIIHSAGVLRDGFIIRKTTAEIEQVFSP